MNRQTEVWATREVSQFELLIFLSVLLVQQGAFVSLPLVMNSETFAEMQALDNPLNKVAIAISLLSIGGICLFQLRALADLVRANVAPTCFTGLVVLSTIWSIHPEITVRRAVTYILTITIAALLPLRLGVDRFMKILSLSFGVSAVGSLLFVLAAPQYGIMHEESLEGCWQGVFCTKEALGSAMAVAVFVEAYLLIESAGRQRWRVFLLGLFFALVVLSGSTTALITVGLYGVGVCLFLLWRQHFLLGLIGVMGTVLTLLMLLIIVSMEPDMAFSAIGKDSTLTGRTTLWSLVLELINERPLLGWGYMAMWQPDDPITVHVDEIAGFAASSAHNTFLEVALELGWTGLVLIVLFIFEAVRRGAQCFVKGRSLLGGFLIMFVVGVVFAGLTTETLGRSQVIEWIVLNSLVFSCGMYCHDIRARRQGVAGRYRQYESIQGTV